MKNKKKLVAITLIVVLGIFILYKLMVFTVFNRYREDAAGTRKEEPVLAVYDLQNEEKGYELKQYTHLYIRWNSAAEKDNAKQIDDSLLAGKNPLLITLEIWPSAGGKLLKENIVDQIAAGNFDKKFKALAAFLSTQSREILLRLNPEMEVYVNRYPWQMKSSLTYIQGFRNFAEIFKKNAPAVKIVWAPAGHPGADEFWPGNDFVDIISVTLKGKSEAMVNNYREPTSMTELVKRKILRARFSDKPVILIGSEMVTEANFPYQSLDTAVKQIIENKEILYKDVTTTDQVNGNELFRKEGSLIIGAYDPAVKIVTNPAITVEHLFANLGELKNGSFRKSFDSVIARNHDVIVTMEPWRDKELEKDPLLIKNILDGKYDSVFKELFSIISTTNRKVYLRWLHEMEIPITRYPWQSQDPLGYVKAFRYFVNKLQPKPANISIVWGPAGDRGSIDFWPGSDVVDYISMAIYGLPDKNITDHNKQEPFTSIFNRKYRRLRFAHKPLFITEFGVKGPDDYKRKWLQDAAATINAHPEIIGVNYFNFSDSPKAWGDIETPDWSTSPAVFNEFVKQLNTGSKK